MLLYLWSNLFMNKIKEMISTQWFYEYILIFAYIYSHIYVNIWFYDVCRLFYAFQNVLSQMEAEINEFKI